MTRAALAVLTALLVVLAGCSGGPMSGDGTPVEGDATDAPGTAETTDGSDSDDSTDGESGSVNFYVSDEPNAMDDFEHLNVTITQVSFHYAGGAANESADNGTATPSETSENETAETDSDGKAAETATPTPDGNATAENETADNETVENATVGDQTAENGTAVDASADDGESETESESESETEAESESEQESESDSDSGDDAERDDEADGDGDGRWVTHEVDNVTVDLTELRGPNATLVQAFDVPAGEYTQVRLAIGEINATLKSGESANVKLPSERLKLNQEFTVENGTEVDFVYDISVHKAGKSGKYILKPVVSESGTDVEIRDVNEDRDDDADRGEGGDRKGERDDRNATERPDRDGEADRNETERPDRDDRNETDDADRSLDAAFVGAVEAGENATVRVTENGDPVANATVAVDDGPEGVTDADGEFTFAVPADAETVAVEVSHGDAEVELERDLQTDGGNGNGSAGENGQGGQASA